MLMSWVWVWVTAGVGIKTCTGYPYLCQFLGDGKGQLANTLSTSLNLRSPVDPVFKKIICLTYIPSPTLGQWLKHGPTYYLKS